MQVLSFVGQHCLSSDVTRVVCRCDASLTSSGGCTWARFIFSQDILFYVSPNYENLVIFVWKPAMCLHYRPLWSPYLIDSLTLFTTLVSLALALYYSSSKRSHSILKLCSLMLQDEILPWFEKTKRKEKRRKEKKTEVTTSSSQLKMKS